VNKDCDCTTKAHHCAENFPPLPGDEEIREVEEADRRRKMLASLDRAKAAFDNSEARKQLREGIASRETLVLENLEAIRRGEVPSIETASAYAQAVNNLYRIREKSDVQQRLMQLESAYLRQIDRARTNEESWRRMVKKLHEENAALRERAASPWRALWDHIWGRL
jgi:uncharacterized membrane-anchored protein